METDVPTCVLYFSDPVRTRVQNIRNFERVDDLHGCASAKTLSPTRRQSVILVVSDDLVMSKMFLQNPYTSSEIILVDVSMSLSLVVIRLGLIEVLLK